MIRLLFIVLIIFSLIPIFAQNETQSENQKIETGNRFLTAIGGSFFGGALGAFVLVQLTEFVKNKREVKRIKLFINSDFSTLNRIIRDSEKTISYYEKLLNENLATSLVAIPDGIVVFGTDVRLTLSFTFWKSLEANASLIKLKPDEIKTIQIIHDVIMIHEKLHEANWDSLTSDLIKITSRSEANSEKEKLVKLRIELYLKLIRQTINSVKEALENIKTIDWIDLEGEVKLPKIEERYQRTIKQNQPKNS